MGRFVSRVLPDKSVEGIPSNDNGFDVEGLAVSGNRVFLGLRGPVLAGGPSFSKCASPTRRPACWHSRVSARRRLLGVPDTALDLAVAIRIPRCTRHGSAVMP